MVKTYCRFCNKPKAMTSGCSNPNCNSLKIKWGNPNTGKRKKIETPW